MDPRQSGESHFVCHDNGNDVITKLAGSCISSLITDTIAAYLANYPDLVRGHTSKLIRGMLIILARYWVRLWGINLNPSIESICCYTQQHCWVKIFEKLNHHHIPSSASFHCCLVVLRIVFILTAGSHAVIIRLTSASLAWHPVMSDVPVMSLVTTRWWPWPARGNVCLLAV